MSISVPTASQITDTSVTLDTMTGGVDKAQYTYAKDGDTSLDDANRQDSPTFNGSTTYKKKTNFGKKAWFVTKNNKIKGYYKNGKFVKKGVRYYYKMRGVRKIDGKTYYTKWSNIVMRTGR